MTRYRRNRAPDGGTGAEVGSEQIERALAAGAREYLTRPLDMARFRAVVDSLLSKVPSRR
jgi:DNA-binding response OmpR family regulator